MRNLVKDEEQKQYIFLNEELKEVNSCDGAELEP